MKEKKKLALLLGLVAVLVVVQFTRRSATTFVPGADSNPQAAAGPIRSLTIPDAVLQTERLQSRSRVRPGGVQRNIFEYVRRSRPAVRKPVQEPVQAYVPPPEPPPPAPVRFYGFAESSRSGRRRVFLTDGEEIYVATEGDVILRRYRVLRVRNESIEVEELAGNHRWVVPLEQP